jgi:hypothetical protein
MAHGMTIQGSQIDQEVPAGALTMPVKMEVDSGVMMASVRDTNRVREEALSEVALEVLAEDQAHVQVCYTCLLVSCRVWNSLLACFIVLKFSCWLLKLK